MSCLVQPEVEDVDVLSFPRTRTSCCHLNHATSTRKKDTHHAHAHIFLLIPFPPSLPTSPSTGHTPMRSRPRLLPLLLLLLDSACLLRPTLAAATSEKVLEPALAHPTTSPLYTNEGPSGNQPALPTLWAGILDLSKPCQKGE